MEIQSVAFLDPEQAVQGGRTLPQSVNGVEGPNATQSFPLGEVEVPDETPVTRATFGRPQIGLGQEVSGANEREAVVNRGEEKREREESGRGTGSSPYGAGPDRQSQDSG